MNRTRILLIAVACLFSSAAQSQWQWKDRDGKTVFSDRAPPADVPLRNIVKQPGAMVRGGAAAQAPVTAASAESPVMAASEPGAAVPVAAVPRLSTEDKTLVERKKQAEAEAAAKLRAEQEKVARVKAENCARVTARKVMLDSGVRMSVTNARGEPEVLDDAGRAAELGRIRAVMAENCQ